jgi:polysaccharide biosynthesis transport protein
MPEPSFHPLDYVSLLRRRKWWMIVPLVLCITGGILLTILLPHVYRSYATIAVSSPRVTPDLIGRASPTERDERLRAITQQLLSRPVLEQVAHAEGLDRDQPLSQAVDEMLQADRIRVEPAQLIKTTQTDKMPLDTFLVSYGGPTPKEAQRVATTLVNVFVEANSRSREARAEDTSAFISNQLADSKNRLDALEAKLRKAKESFMGRLPEQTQANLSMAENLQKQMESTANTLRGEQDRLTMIERQLDAMKQGANDLGVPRGSQLSTAQQHVVQLQQELANARAMYTPKHPEIQRLQDELESARRDAAAERNKPEQERLASLQLDPAYRQLVTDRENAVLRVRDLERAQKQLGAQAAMYQQRIEAAPMVEQQLASLQREYELEKQQYHSLTEKLQAATLAESVERGQGGEQFKVLYTGSRPQSPESPNVLKLMLLAVMAGVVLGAGSAIGREYLDRSVHDVRGLQSEFDVPVLGEIARIPQGVPGAVR